MLFLARAMLFLSFCSFMSMMLNVVFNISLCIGLLFCSSLGISRSEAENAEKGIRLEAIFINGVDRMSTEKVFAYFQEFPPSSIEWIDDSSCKLNGLEDNLSLE